MNERLVYCEQLAKETWDAQMHRVGWPLAAVNFIQGQVMAGTSRRRR